MKGLIDENEVWKQLKARVTSIKQSSEAGRLTRLNSAPPKNITTQQQSAAPITPFRSSETASDIIQRQRSASQATTPLNSSLSDIQQTVSPDGRINASRPSSLPPSRSLSNIYNPKSDRGTADNASARMRNEPPTDPPARSTRSSVSSTT
jgi:hypothetical protein